MLTRLCKLALVFVCLFLGKEAFSQCAGCSAPSAPAERGGTYAVTHYKNSTVQLWISSNAGISGTDWYKVVGTDTIFGGSGDTMTATADTTCKYIARNKVICSCPGVTLYSSYAVMANITVVSAGSVPGYSINSAAVICSGTPTDIFATNYATGMVFEYVRDNTTNVTGSTSGSFNAGPFGLTLTNTTGSSQTVRFMVRMRKTNSPIYYADCQSLYVTVLSGTAPTGNRCFFPSNPGPIVPTGSTNNVTATYYRGSTIELTTDTTIQADSVDWFRVTGTDTPCIGHGYSIFLTADTPCQILARNRNMCNCATASTYSSSYVVMQNITLASGTSPDFRIVNNMGSITSGSQTNFMVVPLSSDGSASIQYEWKKENSYVTAGGTNVNGNYTTAALWNAVNKNGSLGLTLTNTTTSPQLVKIGFRAHNNTTGYFGNCRIVYVLVQPNTTATGSHCYFPTITMTGSTQTYTYFKGSVINLDLFTNGVNPSVADMVDWYQARGTIDTPYLGNAYPVNGTVDTPSNFYKIARNTCVWPDNSTHGYSNYNYPMLIANTTTGTANTVTLTNNAPVLCSGSKTNISLTWASANITSTRFYWNRSNALVTGTTSGSYLGINNDTINVPLTDTPSTAPQVVNFLVNPTSNTGFYGSSKLTSVTVYPPCSAWSGRHVNVSPSIDTICSGDTVTLVSDTLPSMGGTTYAWSTGATTKSIRVTASGTYTVTATNYCGCTASASASVVVNSKPTPTVNSPAICAGATATLTATGGVSYHWNTGATTTSITSTTAATYTVTATNASGCTATASGTVTVNANPTPTVNSPTVCAGVMATLTATGGVSYVWNTTATTTSITTTTAGTYTVTATNAAGCTASVNGIVTVNPVPTPTVNNDTICAGDTATLTATGGVSYVWSNTSTASGITVTTAGIYTVTATNASGCSATASANVIVNSLPTVTVNNDAICAGDTATLIATGGTIYMWNTGDITGSITTTYPGTYSVTVTNASGCIVTSSGSVTVLPAPTPGINNASACMGTTATLTASGGLSYLWGTGATTSSINGSAGSSYLVTVTDTNGCSASIGGFVTPIYPLAISIDTIIICDGDTGLLAVSGTGSYLWSTGATTSSILVSTTGTYSITVTDGSGCTASTTGLVIVNTRPHPDAGSDAAVNNSASVVLGGTSAIGGSSPYIFRWEPVFYIDSPNIQHPSASIFVPSIFILSVIDSNGCRGLDTVNIALLTPIDSPIISVVTDTSFGPSGSILYGDTITFTSVFTNSGRLVYNDTITIMDQPNCDTCINESKIRLYVGNSTSPIYTLNSPTFPVKIPIIDSPGVQFRLEEDMSWASYEASRMSQYNTLRGASWKYNQNIQSTPKVPLHLGGGVPLAGSSDVDFTVTYGRPGNGTAGNYTMNACEDNVYEVTIQNNGANASFSLDVVFTGFSFGKLSPNFAPSLLYTPIWVNTSSIYIDDPNVSCPGGQDFVRINCNNLPSSVTPYTIQFKVMPYCAAIPNQVGATSIDSRLRLNELSNPANAYTLPTVNSTFVIQDLNGVHAYNQSQISYCHTQGVRAIVNILYPFIAQSSGNTITNIVSSNNVHNLITPLNYVNDGTLPYKGPMKIHCAFFVNGNVATPANTNLIHIVSINKVQLIQGGYKWTIPLGLITYTAPDVYVDISRLGDYIGNYNYDIPHSATPVSIGAGTSFQLQFDVSLAPDLCINDIWTTNVSIDWGCKIGPPGVPLSTVLPCTTAAIPAPSPLCHNSGKNTIQLQDIDKPNIVINRIIPVPSVHMATLYKEDAVWEHDCLGSVVVPNAPSSTTEWEYVIQNNGTARARNIRLWLRNASNNSYTYILPTEIWITDPLAAAPHKHLSTTSQPITNRIFSITTSISPQWPIHIPSTVPGFNWNSWVHNNLNYNSTVNPLTFPNTTPMPCLATPDVAISEYNLLIPEMLPGQQLIFHFRTHRCCPSNYDPLALDGVDFNRWMLSTQELDNCSSAGVNGTYTDRSVIPPSVYVAATGQTQFNGSTSGTNGVNFYQVNTPQSGVPLISAEPLEKGTTRDLGLVQYFHQTPAMTDITVPNNTSPPDFYFTNPNPVCIENVHFTSREDGQFWFDPMLLSTDGYIFHDPNGPGSRLIGTNPQGKIIIKLTSNSNGSISFTNPTINDVSNTSWPNATYNSIYGLHGIEMTGTFDIAQLPTNATSDDLSTFIRGSHLCFNLLARCKLDPGNFEFNPDITAEVFFQPALSCTVGGTPGCLIPLARQVFTVHIHCPGCVTPGIYVHSSSLERVSDFSGTYYLAGYNSLGLKDFNNKGVPQNQSGTYTSQNIDQQYITDLTTSNLELNLGGSIPGDYLFSKTSAHLQAGDGGHGGFGISDWELYWQKQPWNGVSPPATLGQTVIDNMPYLSDIFLQQDIKSADVASGEAGLTPETLITGTVTYYPLGGSAQPYQLVQNGTQQDIYSPSPTVSGILTTMCHLKCSPTDHAVSGFAFYNMQTGTGTNHDRIGFQEGDSFHFDFVYHVCGNPATTKHLDGINNIYLMAKSAGTDAITNSRNLTGNNQVVGNILNAHTQRTGHLVISQVYPSGGESGALFDRDFIELYNPTNGPITFPGGKIECYKGGSWENYQLANFTLGAGQYCLITTTTATAGAVGSAPPSPYQNPISASPTNPLLTVTDLLDVDKGMVALVIGSPYDICPPTTNIVDFVGYTTNRTTNPISCFEGTYPAVAPTVGNSLMRLGNGSQDLNQNETDFSSVATIPRNTISPRRAAHLVISQIYINAGNAASSYQDNFIELYNPSTSGQSLNGLHLYYGTPYVDVPLPNVIIDPGKYYLVRIPVGTVGLVALAVPTSADLTGTAASMTSPGVVALTNGIWVSNSCIATNFIDLVGYGATASCKEGSAPVTALATTDYNKSMMRVGNGDQDFDQNNTDFSSQVVNARNGSTPRTIPMSVDHIVINQIYSNGGLGALTSAFTKNFIQLYNPTPAPLPMAGLNLWYHNGSTCSGGPVSVTAAAGIGPQPSGLFDGYFPRTAPPLGSGQYYLIEVKGGNLGGLATFASDAQSTTVISNNSGMLALTQGGAMPLCGTYPNSATNLVDYVGYGPAMTSEAHNPAAIATNLAQSIIRAGNGAQDLNDNGIDFSPGTPNIFSLTALNPSNPIPLPASAATLYTPAPGPTPMVSPNDQGLFSCQGCGSSHYTYPIEQKYYTNWTDDGSCEKQLGVRVLSKIDAGSDNVFPWEYRPMPAVNVTNGVGLMLVNGDPFNITTPDFGNYTFIPDYVESFAPYYTPVGLTTNTSLMDVRSTSSQPIVSNSGVGNSLNCHINNNTSNGVNYVVPSTFGGAISLTSTAQQSYNPSNANVLFSGDEYFDQVMHFKVKQNCIGGGLNPQPIDSPLYTNDAVITVSNQITPNCLTTGNLTIPQATSPILALLNNMSDLVAPNPTVTAHMIGTPIYTAQYVDFQMQLTFTPPSGIFNPPFLVAYFDVPAAGLPPDMTISDVTTTEGFPYNPIASLIHLASVPISGSGQHFNRYSLPVGSGVYTVWFRFEIRSCCVLTCVNQAPASCVSPFTVPPVGSPCVDVPIYYGWSCAAADLDNIPAIASTTTGQTLCFDFHNNVVHALANISGVTTTLSTSQPITHTLNATCSGTPAHIPLSFDFSSLELGGVGNLQAIIPLPHGTYIDNSSVRITFRNHNPPYRATDFASGILASLVGSPPAPSYMDNWEIDLNGVLNGFSSGITSFGNIADGSLVDLDGFNSTDVSTIHVDFDIFTDCSFEFPPLGNTIYCPVSIWGTKYCNIDAGVLEAINTTNSSNSYNFTLGTNSSCATFVTANSFGIDCNNRVHFQLSQAGYVNIIDADAPSLTYLTTTTSFAAGPNYIDAITYIPNTTNANFILIIADNPNLTGCTQTIPFNKSLTLGAVTATSQCNSHDIAASITVNVAAGNPTSVNGYTFRWQNTTTGTPPSTNHLIPPSTNNIATSNSITMAVNNGEPIDVTINTPSTTICAGDLSTFIAVSTNAGSPTYQWFINNLITPITGAYGSTFTPVTPLTNGDIVWCKITTSACGSSSTVTSNGITMSVHALSNHVTPAVAISTTSPHTDACQGDPVTFTATPSFGGNSPIYAWNVNGLTYWTTVPTYTTTFTSSPADISCIVASSAACASPTTASSGTPLHMTFTTVANQTPSVSISVSGQSICMGTLPTFTAVPTNGGPIPSYQWSLNSLPITGATHQAYTPTSVTNVVNHDFITCTMTSHGCITPAYSFSNGGNYTIMGIDAGTYTITVTDGECPHTVTASMGPACCQGDLDPSANPAIDPTINPVTLTWSGTSANPLFLSDVLNYIRANGIHTYPTFATHYNVVLNGYIEVGATSGSTADIGATGIPERLQFGPDAKIWVNHTNTLIVEKGSILEAGCTSSQGGVWQGYMWEGITVEDGSNLAVSDAYIMDAKTAVTVNYATTSGIITLNHGHFYRDAMGVLINGPIAFNSPGCVFGTCTNTINGCEFLYDPGSNTGYLRADHLLSPHIGERFGVGIKVFNNPSVTIGDNFNAANTFKGLNNGILNTGSDLTVNSCRFTDIVTSNNCVGLWCGCGVYANPFNNGTTTTTVQTSTVDPTTLVSPSVTFNNCKTAIMSDGAALSATYNTIEGQSLSTATDYKGIVAQNVLGADIGISSNVIQNIDDGISILSNTNAHTLVSGNFIHVNPYISPRVTTGIHESELLNTVADRVHIETNQIWFGTHQIYMENANNTWLYQNILSFENDANTIPSANSNFQSSIRANNCDNLSIVQNGIIGNGGSYEDGLLCGGCTAPSASTYLKRGMSIESTKNSHICENNVQNIGYAFRYTDWCDFTHMEDNDIGDGNTNGVKVGVFLNQLGFACQIGQQGIPSTTRHNIRFNGPFANNGGGTPSQPFYTFCNGLLTLGSYSPFYYYGSPSVLDPLYNGGSQITNNIVPHTTGASYPPSCSSPPLIFAPYHNTDGENVGSDFAKATVNGDLSGFADPDLYDGAMWIARRRLYQEMKTDTILRNSDSTFLYFYEAMGAGDIGSLAQVEYYIAGMAQATDSIGLDSLVQAAKWANEGVSTETVFSSNAFALNDIYLRTIAIGQAVVDSPDLAAIATLAHSCPYVAGDAVYMARAIYSQYFPLDGFNDEALCVLSGGRYKRQPVEAQNAPVKKAPRLYARVVPNPAANDATLYYYSNGSLVNKVELYDNIGQLVLSKTDPVNSGKIDLNLSELPNGMYMVRFTADGRALLNTKLVVAR